MTQHPHQQIQQAQPSGTGDYAERLVRVEKDVAGLTAGLASLTGSVERGFAALTSDLKARSAFNWQPVSILVVVLLGVAGWGWALFGSYQARTDAAIAEQKLTTSRFVDRADIADKFQVAKEKRDDAQRMTDARIERVERDLDAVAKQVVPREEHRIVRELQQRDYGLLRDRIERVEGRSVKAADGLARDLERLEDRTLPRSEALARNDAQDKVTGLIRGELDEHVRAFNDRQQRWIDRLEATPRK